MNVMATPEILSTVILAPDLILRSSKRKEQKYHKYCWHKITRHSAEMYWGQGYRQTHKQYSVQVICCISGRRVVHMTLTATQNTGNYRNSQAMGKAFIHSGFTATIHLHWVCIVSDVTLGVPAKHWLTPQKITVCWGRYQGMNSHSDSSWALRCTTLIISSFIKTHRSNTCPLPGQSAFPAHLLSPS